MVSNEAAKSDEELLQEIHFMSLHRVSVQRTVAGFLYAAFLKKGITGVSLSHIERELAMLSMAMESNPNLRRKAVELYRVSATALKQEPPEEQVRRDHPGDRQPQGHAKRGDEKGGGGTVH